MKEWQNCSDFQHVQCISFSAGGTCFRNGNMYRSTLNSTIVVRFNSEKNEIKNKLNSKLKSFFFWKVSRPALSEFLDPPLKGSSKTLCREEPNMLTVFTTNISIIALCLRKPWETCKGIGLPMQVPQFLNYYTENLTSCLYLFMPVMKE